MADSQEHLDREVRLERRACESRSPQLRADYLKAAEGWRDLARRAKQLERRGRRDG